MAPDLSGDAIINIVDRIYAAALNGNAWPKIADEIAALLDASQMPAMLHAPLQCDTDDMASDATILPSLHDGFQALARQEALELLTPHIARALNLMRCLREAESQAATSLATLDHMRCGVLILDRMAHIDHANREAMRMIEQQDGLSAGETLFVRDRDARLAWENLVHAVISRDVANAPRFADAIVVRRPSGRRPFLLQAAPIPDDSALVTRADVVAIAFITDPEREVRLAPALLRDLFQATPAECRLADALCNGLTLTLAAAECGIGITTARSHLAALFQKTGTQRQAELIRVLMSLA